MAQVRILNKTQANFCQANFDPPRQILAKFCSPTSVSFWYGARARRMRAARLRRPPPPAHRRTVRLVPRPLAAAISHRSPAPRRQRVTRAAPRGAAGQRGGVCGDGRTGSSSRAITVRWHECEQGRAGGCVLAGWLSESVIPAVQANFSRFSRAARAGKFLIKFSKILTWAKQRSWGSLWLVV